MIEYFAILCKDSRPRPPFPAVTIFKCQMVCICANMNRFNKKFPRHPSTVHVTVCWYSGEIQENYSSYETAASKEYLLYNQKLPPFSVFFCLYNFKVGGSDHP